MYCFCSVCGIILEDDAEDMVCEDCFDAYEFPIVNEEVELNFNDESLPTNKDM